MLPAEDRLLLGPGPSPVSSRVMAALGAPTRSHLDPDLIALLDDIRARLARVFRAPDDALVLAVSGTGTAAMEAAVANTVAPGCRALAVVNGYFGERLADMLARHGAEVDRLIVDWGRAVDPAAVASRLQSRPSEVVTIVHAETSTGVRNPVEAITAVAHARDALVIADVVTSLGAVPVDMAAWRTDVCYSCGQKGIGAPPGLSPIAFSARALSRRVAARSFYLDVTLLAAYWRDRKYHHTIASPLVYALQTALCEVEEEGLAARWARHERVHHELVTALREIDLDLLPAPVDRLWSLNAVAVPPGVDEAAVRAGLLRRHGIEIGAGLGPLAGRIWRVGLMGAGATTANVRRVTDALRAELAAPARSIPMS